MEGGGARWQKGHRNNCIKVLSSITVPVFQIIIPSTYVCSCVRCVCVCVCDERGREGGGSHFRSPLSNFLILSRRGSSTNNERPGNRPSSTKVQHQRPRFRKNQTNLFPLYGTQKKNIKTIKLFFNETYEIFLAFSFLTICSNQPIKPHFYYQAP